MRALSSQKGRKYLSAIGYNRNQDWQPIFHSTVGYRKIEKHSLFRKPIVPTPKSDLHTSKTL